MEDLTASEIAVNLLKTKDSLEKLRRLPAGAVKKANSLDAVAKAKVTELKNKTGAYGHLERMHNLKSGNTRAAGDLLASMMKPRKAHPAPVPVRAAAHAKRKPAAAFCGNCGTKLNPGAAFCPNCGNKIG